MNTDQQISAIIDYLDQAIIEINESKKGDADYFIKQAKSYLKDAKNIYEKNCINSYVIERMFFVLESDISKE